MVCFVLNVVFENDSLAIVGSERSMRLDGHNCFQSIGVEDYVYGLLKLVESTDLW